MLKKCIEPNHQRKEIKEEKKLESNDEEIHKVEATKKGNHRQRNLENDAEETQRTEATKKRNQRQRNLEHDAEPSKHRARIEDASKRVCAQLIDRVQGESYANAAIFQ